jgi:hypothetical protein
VLDPVTELESVIDVLVAAGVEYALCGGLALAVHGYPRATMDIDLLVRAESVPAALAAVAAAGFDVPARRMVFGLATGNPREVQRVSKLDASGAMLALDLICVSPALESVWASRIEVGAGARRMVVVSRDGLATMKKLAARPQDLADVAKLEGTDEPPESE